MNENRKASRRSFLKTSAACGIASLAFPAIIPSHVLAGIGPNEKIGLGFIGVGRRAQQLMNDWEFKANFQIIAQNTDPGVLSDHSENKPAYNIFISLLRSLGRNYRDYPIKLKLVSSVVSSSEVVLSELPG